MEELGINTLGRKRFKMLEKTVHSMTEKYAAGIRMIENNQYDSALQYFTDREKDDDAVVHYGIATAMFKKMGHRATKPEITGIVDGYIAAINRDGSFADAHYMCGLAYQQLAQVEISEYKQSKNPAVAVQAIEDLHKAKDHAKRAGQLNPRFKDLADTQVKYCETYIAGVKHLRTLLERLN
jgi:hypothetical protein